MSLQSLTAELRRLGIKPIPFIPVGKLPKREPISDQQIQDTVARLLVMQAAGKCHFWVDARVIRISKTDERPKRSISWGKAWLIAVRGRI